MARRVRKLSWIMFVVVAAGTLTLGIVAIFALSKSDAYGRVLLLLALGAGVAARSAPTSTPGPAGLGTQQAWAAPTSTPGPAGLGTQQAWAAPPPVTLAAAPQPDRLDQLERLGALHANGTLTDAEFAAQKAKILGS